MAYPGLQLRRAKRALSAFKRGAVPVVCFQVKPRIPISFEVGITKKESAKKEHIPLTFGFWKVLDRQGAPIDVKT